MNELRRPRLKQRFTDGAFGRTSPIKYEDPKTVDEITHEIDEILHPGHQSTPYRKPKIEEEIQGKRNLESPNRGPFRRRRPSWDSEEAGEGREYPEDRADMEKDYSEKEAIVNSAESEYSNEGAHDQKTTGLRSGLIGTDNFYE